jgi:hypothetical protein
MGSALVALFLFASASSHASSANDWIREQQQSDPGYNRHPGYRNDSDDSHYEYERDYDDDYDDDRYDSYEDDYRYERSRRNSSDDDYTYCEGKGWIHEDESCSYRNKGYDSESTYVAHYEERSWRNSRFYSYFERYFESWR